jgi:hypothetical protein
MSGWVKVHRKIMDSPGYFEEPFCRNMAWIDMLLLANHRQDYFRCRGIKVVVERGQIGYTSEALGQRWRWSRGKVLRFLSELEKEGKIVQQKNRVTTLISIVKYEDYQGNGTTNSTTDGTTNGQQTVQQTDTNKNVKNDKNIKNDKKNTDADASDLREWVDEWFRFYEGMVGVKPNYNGVEANALKTIRKHLKDIEAWRQILNTWSCQDEWLRTKLELKIISSKINTVLVNAKKAIDDTNFRGNTKSNSQQWLEWADIATIDAARESVS